MLNGYAKMDAETLEMTARILSRVYQRNKSGGTSGNKEKCDGTVQVGEYTRSDGTKVSAYERSCPYHNGTAGNQDAESSAQYTPHGLSLNQNFSSDGNANGTDVINLKTNLAKMNYYHADAKSEKDGNFHKYPNDGLVTAIKQFQKDNGITPDGRVIKGGATEAAINSKFESHGVRFEYPVNTDERQVAVFDGKSFTLYQDNKPIVSWDAVSGKSGYQSPEYQNVRNKGPLPEGTYVARQSELYYFDDMSKIDQELSKTGLLTKFPGGRKSWGNSKVVLEPSNQNNMLGRANFTIHGGKEPGSRGCIDLTNYMDNFTNWFTNNKKDLIIKVKY